MENKSKGKALALGLLYKIRELRKELPAKAQEPAGPRWEGTLEDSMRALDDNGSRKPSEKGEAMTDCNALIGEFLEAEPENYKCSTPQDCPFEDDGGLGSGECATCDKEVPIYPDYCGCDADALEGLKALFDMGLYVDAALIPNADGSKNGTAVVTISRPYNELRKVVGILSSGQSDEICHAFRDAMCEEYNITLPSDDCTERLVWRLRPALEKLKGDGSE